MLSNPVEKSPVRVSILVAARNEEQNIERCLRSLDALDFPEDQIEILIGDDDSEDQTGLLVQRFCVGRPRFKYVKIIAQVAGLKGKANVLAQLAHLATGEYFFYCDADIAVKPGWISVMLTHFKEKTGVVVGLTRMKNESFFTDLLSMEWLFAISNARFFSLFKIPITGMGNNMAVTRKAYFDIGGYEKIGFSVVEDYALFIAIVRNGFGFQMAYKAEIINISEPVTTWAELMKQRKRWMQGVMQSFWITKWSLIFSSTVVPILLIASIWLPIKPLPGILQYYAFVTAICLLSIFILKQYDLWKVALVFWFYMIGIGVTMLINYFLPGKMVWKGRKY
jgi:cellulose synthase/poly-beta-1,6-N-acetylglucosamine synthase-like glycosyltransferase